MTAGGKNAKQSIRLIRSSEVRMALALGCRSWGTAGGQAYSRRKKASGLFRKSLVNVTWSNCSNGTAATGDSSNE